MESEKTLEEFILDNFDTTIEEIYEAMSLATTIVYRDGMVMMMSKDFVYYFGAIKKLHRTKQLYRFSKGFDVKGCSFVSKDPRMYQSLIKKGIITQIRS